MSDALTLRPVSPTAQTDEELVTRSWGGDDEALETLLTRYRNFVRMKARSYFLVGADREDVVQEGMIGLYKAIRDYKDDREASFRGFAELCITRQIITAIKTATRQKHHHRHQDRDPPEARSPELLRVAVPAGVRRRRA